MMSFQDIMSGVRRDGQLFDPVTCLVGMALYCLWSVLSHSETGLGGTALGQVVAILQHVWLAR